MRTKLADRTLPDYTKGEEWFNMISHIAGGGLGVIALAVCVLVSALRGNGYGIASSIVYGITMILLYCMSSVYHGLKNGRAKKIMQVLDHCAIYLLIAGTYTPIALSALRAADPVLGWTLFGMEWGLAAVAVTFTAIDLKRYNLFSMICYIGMGWGVLLFLRPVAEAIGWNGFLFLLAGGCLYTVGAVLYALGKKKRYMHNVFHIFVLLGSFVHFLAIVLYAL